MWKNSKKTKKVKLKFRDDYTIKELADDLKTLNDIQVLDYKINGADNFSVAFNTNFVDYYNENHERLQQASMQNMVGAIHQFPDQKPDPDSYATMFYSTVILSYLNETGLIKKIDISNVELLGRLIVTVEDLRELMVEDTEKT